MPPQQQATQKVHVPFDAECRCQTCRMGGAWKKQPGATEAWHRISWSSRKQRHKDYPLDGPAPDVAPGPTASPVHRTYNGPVHLRATESTFLHTRKLSHTHRTTLLRSSVPNRETNFGSLFGEMDARLQNMHRTLAAVKARSSAVVGEERAALGTRAGAADSGANSGGGGGGEALAVALATCSDGSGGHDTIALRRAVNARWGTQVDLYTDCMVRWCLGKCACACTPCGCVCQEAHARLAERVYGS
ncbi:hypothetical protein FOA52_001112 [Chlamydomonas sp. UWO 241]|nr:hypothetical protein FOA52_001112 [Chlamydomonas sp. UWO 241]